MDRDEAIGCLEISRRRNRNSEREFDVPGGDWVCGRGCDWMFGKVGECRKCGSMQRMSDADAYNWIMTNAVPWKGNFPISEVERADRFREAPEGRKLACPTLQVRGGRDRCH